MDLIPRLTVQTPELTEKADELLVAIGRLSLAELQGAPADQVEALARAVAESRARLLAMQVALQAAALS